MSTNVEDFMRNCEQAAQKIQFHVKQSDFIQITSHIDADGITAASIIGKAVYRIGGYFNLRIVKQLDEKLVNQLSLMKCKVYVFTDIGSGYLDILEKLHGSTIIVLDHHEPMDRRFANLIHVNPHLHKIDGAREISGAGVSYFVAKKISEENIDQSPLAIVGALGDLQDKNKKRSLQGLNQIIVDDAVKTGLVSVASDLLFYGRETRPIHKAVASTMNPFIPGLSGEEDKCLGFFVNLGIPLKSDDRWRTMADLNLEEKQKIFSQITMHLTSHGFSGGFVLNLLGATYTLNSEDKWTPLRDAREFSSTLNACGKMGKPGVGISLCLGERGVTMDEAQNILNEYRKKIAQTISLLLETKDRIRELENIYVIKGEDIVDENMLSPITTIIATSGVCDPTKPVIATTRTKEGEIKISARISDTLVERGVSIGLIMQIAAEKSAGKGGGHDVAAGATIPGNEEENFILAVEELTKEKLQGGKAESKN
jgi:RecJ-like exonuclease